MFLSFIEKVSFLEDYFCSFQSGLAVIFHSDLEIVSLVGVVTVENLLSV